MNCNNECSTCKTNCALSCPICNQKGMMVRFDAAKNLVKDNKYLNKKQKVYICTNKKCEVVYYQKDNPKQYLKEEIKVPIWFKEKYDKYLVCYCHNIYLDDIVRIVLNSTVSEKLTIEDIKKQFPKVKENCKIKNPIGNSCERLFENAIEYAYKKKEEEKQ